MGEISGEFDELVEAEARAFEDRAQIVQHLAHLGVEIVLADHATIAPDGELTGDV